MNNSNLKIFFKIYIVGIIVLLPILFLIYEMKLNLINDSVRNFILIKDLTSLKYVLTPMLKGDLSSILIRENETPILTLSSDRFFLKNFNYSRTFNVSNNQIRLEFAPYYIYAGFILHLLITYLLSSVYFLRREKQQILQENFQLSQKLAHDIRSPISTLNLISSKIENHDIKSLQLAVVDQINAIADDLLNKSHGSKLKLASTSKLPHQHKAPYLTEMLQNVEKEYLIKQAAISQRIDFQIDYQMIEKKLVNQKLCSIVYTCLNNFIQNAIEATTQTDTICVYATVNSNQQIQISVVDTGRGIPANLLPRLGHEIISYGKTNTTTSTSHASGQGIALYNAHKELTQNGAELSIKSVENTKTEITIII